MRRDYIHYVRGDRANVPSTYDVANVRTFYPYDYLGYVYQLRTMLYV